MERFYEVMFIEKSAPKWKKNDISDLFFDNEGFLEMVENVKGAFSFKMKDLK